MLLLGFVVALQSRTNLQLQTGIVVLMAFFYVILGILHHYLDHNITVKIVVEYVLMSSIGIAIFFFFVKGGF